MKKTQYLFLFFALLFAACDKTEEVKLEAFSAEAFAYDIGTSWEINSSIRVKGFAQSEEGGVFKHSVNYEASIITPSGESIPGIASGTLNESSKEKLQDLGIEVQYELDKSRGPGKYKIVYAIKDDRTGQTVKGEKEFEAL